MMDLDRAREVIDLYFRTLPFPPSTLAITLTEKIPDWPLGAMSCRVVAEPPVITVGGVVEKRKRATLYLNFGIPVCMLDSPATLLLLLHSVLESMLRTRLLTGLALSDKVPTMDMLRKEGPGMFCDGNPCTHSPFRLGGTVEVEPRKRPT